MPVHSVIKPAPAYNKQGRVVEATQDIVDAVDKFTPPTGFVRKGSRDKSYMYSVGVYVEHTEFGSGNNKYHCLANSHCRRTSKVIPCKRGDLLSVCGNLFVPNRSRIDTYWVEMLMFIKINYKHIPALKDIPMIADKDIRKCLPARFTGARDADLKAAEAAFDVVNNTANDIGL